MLNQTNLTKQRSLLEEQDPIWQNALWAFSKICTPILFRAIITSSHFLDALVFHSVSPLDIITGFKLCKYMKQKAVNDIELVASGAKVETVFSCSIKSGRILATKVVHSVVFPSPCLVHRVQGYLLNIRYLQYTMHCFVSDLLLK